ncbi:MAG: hypothetical protein U5K77_03450 [Candidatus Saccharibacteria bacterium]|nr:hypothetical protein [Candidatus Saccharibacteria bacterium]
MQILFTLLVLIIWTAICAYGIRQSYKRRSKPILLVWVSMFIIVSVYIILTLID